MLKAWEFLETQNLGLWTRKFPFEGQLLACSWALTETAPITEGCELKPDTHGVLDDVRKAF